MQQRLTLLSCIWLTLFMHFLLPYAALAEESTMPDNHGPPPPESHHHDDIEGHSIHELPHHIEPKENELEEVDELDDYVELLPQQQSETKEKTPTKALFVYEQFLYADLKLSSESPCVIYSHQKI